MVTSEEIEEAKQGGKAFEELWQKERGMIRFEMFRDRSRMNGREDFELLAQTGLWHSLLRYDHTRGASFETYAKRCMLSAIYGELGRTRYAPEMVELEKALGAKITLGGCDRVEPVRWEILDNFGRMLMGDEKQVWHALVEDGSEWEYELAQSLGMSLALFSYRKRELFRRFVEYLYG